MTQDIFHCYVSVYQRPHISGDTCLVATISQQKHFNLDLVLVVGLQAGLNATIMQVGAPVGGCTGGVDNPGVNLGVKMIHFNMKCL